MHIFFYIMYWYPYEGALQSMYGRLFQELSREGHRISIVTSLPHFRKGRPEVWREYKGKLFDVEEQGNIQIIRSWVFAPLFRSDSLNVLMRFINYLSFLVSSLFVSLKYSRNVGLVFTLSSPPFLGALVGLIVARLRGIPAVFNVQDMYPEFLEQAGLLKSKTLLNVFYGLDSFLMRRFDRILVISRAFREILIKKRGVKAEKITVISNFQDVNFIKPMDKKNTFSTEFNIDNDFVVLFAGNMGYAHGLEYVIEAAKILSKEERIKFVFIGRGDFRNKIENISREYGLKNTVFLPLQPYKNMPLVWASCDAAIISLRKGFEKVSSPSKLFGIMASGRPALAMLDNGSDISDIISRANCGICVPAESPKLLVESVMRLFSNTDLKLLMGKNGRRYAIENYSFDIIYKKYKGHFLSLI